MASCAGVTPVRRSRCVAHRLAGAAARSPAPGTRAARARGDTATRPAVGRATTAEDLQQRGLAGAVGADEADARPRARRRGRPREQLAIAEPGAHALGLHRRTHGRHPPPRAPARPTRRRDTGTRRQAVGAVSRERRRRPSTSGVVGRPIRSRRSLVASPSTPARMSASMATRNPMVPSSTPALGQDRCVLVAADLGGRRPDGRAPRRLRPRARRTSTPRRRSARTPDRRGRRLVSTAAAAAARSARAADATRPSPALVSTVPVRACLLQRLAVVLVVPVVAQDRPREAGRPQHLLGRLVLGRQRPLGSRRLGRARVDDASDTGGPRGLDGAGVLSHAAPGLAAGDEQDGVGTRERGLERRGVVVVGDRGPDAQVASGARCGGPWPRSRPAPGPARAGCRRRGGRGGRWLR